MSTSIHAENIIIISDSEEDIISITDSEEDIISITDSEDEDKTDEDEKLCAECEEILDGDGVVCCFCEISVCENCHEENCGEGYGWSHSCCRCKHICSDCILVIERDYGTTFNEKKSIEYMEINPHAFNYLDEELQHKKPIICKAISGCPCIYYDLPDDLQNDPLIMYTFLKNYRGCSQHVEEGKIITPTKGKLTLKSILQHGGATDLIGSFGFLKRNPEINMMCEKPRTAILYIKYLADSIEEKPLFFTFAGSDITFSFDFNSKNKRKYEEKTCYATSIRLTNKNTY